MYQSTITTALLLVGQVLAGGLEDAGGLFTKRDVYMEGSMKRYAAELEISRRDAAGTLDRRQNQSLGSGLTATQWDAQTMLACTKSLEALNGKATNDAGMAVCYNVPKYNATSGVFEADMRLFKIAEPSGSFATIPAKDVVVGVAYVGSSVQPVPASEIGRRQLDERATNGDSLISWPKAKRAAIAPNMTQAYAFVGQINKEFIGTSMTDAQVEKLMTPTVTLTGTTSSGASVNTTINPTEAAFVSGVFAKQVAVAKASVAKPIQTLVVASDAPFILPGTQILIFPIGGIITGIWAILFVSTIAYGTVGRMQFRDQFRRRQQLATNNFRPTI